MPTSSITLPDIFQYIDYRQYIVDLVAALHKEKSGFSFAAFAETIGTVDPGRPDKLVTMYAYLITLQFPTHRTSPVLPCRSLQEVPHTGESRDQPNRGACVVRW